MDDAVEIVLSWFVILFVAVFCVSWALFTHETDELTSFNQQVQPVIERYGGANTGDLYHDGSTAKGQIEDIERTMDNHGTTFNVRTNDDNDSDARPISYGHAIYYNTSIKTPFNMFHHTLNRTVTNATSSKVGA